ncbi:MAG TPA: amino acid permease [Thermoleophilaceae bacterium]|nr:amino acid permease [Thermoleophilaceae bacterium]
MARAAHRGLFTTKSTRQLKESADSTRLNRAVGAVDLTAFGIGAIIGTGIFVIIGEAIGDSGPGIVLSFVLAGVTCMFSALSYAELASSIPVSGSAYTYSYATMGELVAWVIGWDLILEYGVSVAAVAVGWGGYAKELLHSLFGITLPASIALPPGEGGSVNLPAVFIVLLVTGVLVAGVRQSARANTIMVVVKLVVLVLFVALAVGSFKSGNLKPFAPNGFKGIREAAALIFFAYIGFDAVSTGSEESKRPARDLPIAIIGSLLIATVLYIVVAIVATGVLPYNELKGSESPLADVLSKGAGLSWGADLISFGAIVAITSVVLTILFGQIRIMYSMSRDGLVPKRLGDISERTQTPILVTALFGTLIAILAALVPLTEIAKLVNIGTLFAFLVVNIGVIILRRTKPDLERSFKVPLVPFFPLIGAALCIYLMTQLEGLTWLRFGVWLVIGLVIYATYGYSHSKLRNA